MYLMVIEEQNLYTASHDEKNPTSEPGHRAGGRRTDEVVVLQREKT